MKKSTLITTFKVSALALAVAGMTGCLGGGSSSSKPSLGSGDTVVSPDGTIENPNFDVNNTSINTGAYLDADGNVKENFTLDNVTSVIHPDTRISRVNGEFQDFETGVSGIDIIEDGAQLDLTVVIDGVARTVRLIEQDENEYFSSNGQWFLEIFGDNSDLDFSYMTLGEWVNSESGFDGDIPDNFTAGVFATGLETALTDMPSSGTIQYFGFYQGVTELFDDVAGNASMSANFGSSEFSLTLQNVTTFTGDISGNTFSDGAGLMSGRFFGPQAVEAGGTWTHTNDGVRSLGVFGVTSDPSQIPQ